MINDVQKILDVTFPFVETLLKEYGEFYPLASVVDNSGNVQQVLLEEDEENDYPKSNTVVGELKKQLRWNQQQFFALAIFYDVAIKEIATDAVAVYVEHKDDEQAYVYYYPYTIIEGNLTFLDSWKEREVANVFER